MVVDDDRDSADSLADLLSLVGCDARASYHGGEVVSAARVFEPDVCILDLAMPVVDGWEVAKSLRKWANGRLLLLIALTGYGEQEVVDHSFDAGFDHHLLKPASPEELFADLAAYIRRMEPKLQTMV